jgi:hypothetical protein
MTANRTSFTLPLITLIGVLSLSTAVSNRALDDWPQWRGPNRDGRSPERGLLKDWPSGGPRLMWRATGAGAGYSSFAVAGGRLFTLGARGDREYVIAYDVSSGKQVWATAHGRRFGNDRGDGPRSTPTVEGNRVYVFGASGDLSVLDAASGKIVWSVNVLEKFRSSPSSSPRTTPGRGRRTSSWPPTATISFARRSKPPARAWPSRAGPAGRRT